MESAQAHHFNFNIISLICMPQLYSWLDLAASGANSSAPIRLTKKMKRAMPRWERIARFERFASLFR